MRPTVAIVDLDAIRFNVSQVKKQVAPADIMAVVKSNAYGHGDYEVSKVALASGATYLGVALVSEGISLRKKGIDAPILVFGGFFPQDVPLYLDYDLECTLYTEHNLQALQQSTINEQRIKVQIKIDTGMGRVGVPVTQAIEFVKKVARCSDFELVGIYTHFATSDEKDNTFANLQLERFVDLNDQIENEGIQIPYKHTANSGAILDLPKSYFNMVRPGVMLYGYYPSRETTESLQLQPAMTLKSKVIFVKRINKNDSVSYGRKFIAKQDTNIATIPIGYADGYNRLLSNRANVRIEDDIYPVVGRVCMDQILIDLGPETTVRTGDEVILLDPDVESSVHMNHFCEMLDTIPYELCCRISERVPRVYLN